MRPLVTLLVTAGIAFAQGHIFMASLRGERLWAIPVADGKRIGEPQAFFTNKYGRLRTVEAAPDGSLWVTTSNTDGRGQPHDGDDRILRVTIRSSRTAVLGPSPSKTSRRTA